MINTTTFRRFVYASAAAAVFVLVSGNLSEIRAQRDPFAKPGYMKVRKPVAPKPVSKDKTPKVVVPYAPPAIESRIEYYKRLRQDAIASGQMPPKVTSVLTLNEMVVTGIFKSPRGWAAMVEATPIKLSFSIYPGEKFFDGQLVAVEENRLVFRKVTKMGPNKFVASVENMPLRQYTTKSLIEGTAPSQPGYKSAETAESVPPAAAPKDPKAAPIAFISPVDEMNSMPPQAEEKPAKSTKKPVRTAKNKRP